MDEYSRHAMQSVMESAGRQAEKDMAQNTPVIPTYQALVEHVTSFQDGLDDVTEVGARLVNFGTMIQIHVHSIGYSAPFLLVFKGVSEDGNQVQLVQHYSQLNILLVALKKLKSEPYRVGFIWNGDA